MIAVGKIEFENKIYDFKWIQILILFVGAPALALGMWYSHDWIWLHKISAEFTVWLLNLFTNGENYVTFNASSFPTPYIIHIVTSTGSELMPIHFESLCTGVHAIAIFWGVILFIPHSLDIETSRTIWIRKGLAALVTAIVFYFVNIFRMILQLALYRNGANWDDVHYPISAASSFIAVACVLLMHKFTPEFIMSLIWIGDEVKALLRKRRATANSSQTTPESIPTSNTSSSNDTKIDDQKSPDPPMG